MADELRNAAANAYKLKNRVNSRRATLHDPATGSRDQDAPMLDLEMSDQQRNVEKTPSTQRKKTSKREREEKKYSDASSSESGSDSESESMDQGRTDGSLQQASRTGPVNNAQGINNVNNSQGNQVQQPVQNGQIPPPGQGDDDQQVHEDDGDQQDPPVGNHDGNGQPPGLPQRLHPDDLERLLKRLVTTLNQPSSNRQQKRAKECKEKRDDDRVPAKLPNFSGKEGTISLEEWNSRLIQTAELRSWSDKQLLFVMLCKLKPPASDYIYGLGEEKRNSIKNLTYELTMLYGESRLSKQDHYRELIKAPQRPVEKASDYLNCTMAHYRHLMDVDRLSLLEMLLSPEYSEQLRLANVQTFDQALPIILAYEKTLKNSSAFARSGHATESSSVNAIYSSNSSPNDVTEIVRRNREELDSLRDRFATFESLIRDLSKVVKKKNNNTSYNKPDKWCSFHKTNGHSDAECRRQKSDSNQSNGANKYNFNGRNRFNGSSGNGRSDGSSSNQSKN